MIQPVIFAVALLVVSAGTWVLLGQVLGPQTMVEVEHSGLDEDGNPEDMDRFEVRLYPKDADQNAPALGVFTLPKSGLGRLGPELARFSGAHQLRVVAIDKAQNESVPLTLEAIVDSTRPRKPLSLRVVIEAQLTVEER